MPTARRLRAPPSPARPRLAWRPLLATLVLGIGIGTVMSGGVARADRVDDTYKKLRVFSQVLAYVQQNYVDAVDDEDLIYDGVTGMLSDLDPHTTFMRPEEYQKLREDTAGEFGGLGIEVTETDTGTIRIDQAAPDGPADRAGIRGGDRIVRVDGISLAKMHLPDAVKLMRGVPGTKVVLGIEREGWSRARDIPLIRRHVRTSSVRWRLLDDGFGYVRMIAFQERTDHELGEALVDLRRQVRAAQEKRGATLNGLVLDLRDNPGGLFDEATLVADRFLRSGNIVTTKGRNPRNTEVDNAHEGGTEGDYPMVVLVNGGSASASEIVAGALQDQRRAKIIGTQSYGKGSVQTLFGLDDGSGLKLTVARYFTPSGRSIQQKGITPDVVVPPGRVGPNNPSDPLLVDAQVVQALRNLKAR